MSELPKGWAAATLRDLSADISYGFTTSADANSGKPRLLRITDLQDNSVDWNNVPFCSDEPDEKFDLVDGDIVVARTGATTGKNYLISTVPERTVFASYLIRIRTAEHVEPRYISEFMKSPNYWDHITTVSKGVAQPGANATVLGNLEVPLPPLPEQRRIVGKLDTLSVRTTTARTHLTAIAKLVGKYKAGVLEAAFANSGPNATIGELIDGIKAGKNLKCDERPPRDGEQGTVKVSAVSWGEFRADQSKTFPPHFEPDPDTVIKSGDFLFSRANTIELVGAVVIVGNAPGNLFLSDKVLRLDMADHIKPWLLWFLRSPQGRKQLEEVSSGNQMSMRNIGQAKLKSLVLPLPDDSQRENILSRIETAFAKIDRLAAEAEKALKLTERLDQRILAKAFAGELVPQDPSDEPATNLLARIREARATAPKSKRGRRKKVAS